MCSFVLLNPPGGGRRSRCARRVGTPGIPRHPRTRARQARDEHDLHDCENAMAGASRALPAAVQCSSVAREGRATTGRKTDSTVVSLLQCSNFAATTIRKIPRSGTPLNSVSGLRMPPPLIAAQGLWGAVPGHHRSEGGKRIAGGGASETPPKFRVRPRSGTRYHEQPDFERRPRPVGVTPAWIRVAARDIASSQISNGGPVR